MLPERSARIALSPARCAPQAEPNRTKTSVSLFGLTYEQTLVYVITVYSNSVARVKTLKLPRNDFRSLFLIGKLNNRMLFYLHIFCVLLKYFIVTMTS